MDLNDDRLHPLTVAQPVCAYNSPLPNPLPKTTHFQYADHVQEQVRGREPPSPLKSDRRLRSLAPLHADLRRPASGAQLGRARRTRPRPRLAHVGAHDALAPFRLRHHAGRFPERALHAVRRPLLPRRHLGELDGHDRLEADRIRARALRQRLSPRAPRPRDDLRRRLLGDLLHGLHLTGLDKMLPGAERAESQGVVLRVPEGSDKVVEPLPVETRKAE